MGVQERDGDRCGVTRCQCGSLPRLETRIVGGVTENHRLMCTYDSPSHYLPGLAVAPLGDESVDGSQIASGAGARDDVLVSGFDQADPYDGILACLHQDFACPLKQLGRVLFPREELADIAQGLQNLIQMPEMRVCPLA